MTETDLAHLRVRFRPLETQFICPHEGGCERCIIWSLLEHISAQEVLANSLKEELHRVKSLT
jgi:hypothetical protein